MQVVGRAVEARVAGRPRQRFISSARRGLFNALILSVLVIVGGTLGYMLLEGWSLSDAFYMTMISITTVGYGETQPLDTSGRLLTVALILGGISIVGYSLTVLASSLVESEITGRARERRMHNAIGALSRHVILCGFGRVGVSVARELHAEHVPFVIVDQNPDRVAECSALGYLVVAGDATDDLILSAAGVERASALISALDDDAQNVFITLSARVLNPGIAIAARAADPQSERKLTLAGAQHVVSPYVIAGHRLAGVVVRPRVIEFLDTVIYSSGLEFWLEEVSVGPESPIAGKTISDLQIARETGALLLAIVRADGGRVPNPHPETMISANDTLIAIGTREQLGRLQRFAGDGRGDDLDEGGS
jgi:voltage-gated potassium channel